MPCLSPGSAPLSTALPVRLHCACATPRRAAAVLCADVYPCRPGPTRDRQRAGVAAPTRPCTAAGRRRSGRALAEASSAMAQLQCLVEPVLARRGGSCIVFEVGTRRPDTPTMHAACRLEPNLTDQGRPGIASLVNRPNPPLPTTRYAFSLCRRASLSLSAVAFETMTEPIDHCRTELYGLLPRPS